MIEPKLEVPAELRDLAEKTIDQAEKAFALALSRINLDDLVRQAEPLRDAS